MQNGFLIPVTVATPASITAPPLSIQPRAIAVFALLDTGATRTNIDTQIADYLNLAALGYARVNTAAGLMNSATYAVDLQFSGDFLRPTVDLLVGACKLGYRPDMEMSQNNYGVLIGRDLMSKWNIVWNGPTSSVFISD
jgi:hypothetical protein